MADDPNTAPSLNPFDQIDAEHAPAAASFAPPTAPAPAETAVPPTSRNPFDDIDTSGKPEGESGTFGSFMRHAARSALPSLGGLAAAGPGAEAGAAIGAFGGPFAEFTVPAGALVGGIGGMMLGGTAIDKAQDYALSAAPDSWVEAIGQDDRQRQLDEKLHPYASFLGGLAPFAVTMRPGGLKGVALPENATAFQRLMANPVTARVFGGAVVGGMELGQEAIGGQPLDWRKAAIATGFGLIFNKPTRLGEAITEIGARRTRALLGRGEPALPKIDQQIEPETEAPPTTVAQAGDLKVMGPGVTEEVFHGTHEMAPDAAMSAQEMARTEAALVGEPPPPPDLHEVARRIDPDTFARYDELLARRDTFEAALGETRGPDAALVRTNAEIAELVPQVAAAYRRAAEAVGAPTAEPAAAPAPVEAAATEQQRTAIAADVTRQMLAAGQPQATADAYARLTADYWVTRAQRFGGALGTAQELYGREGARIVGGRQPPQPRPPRPARAPREQSLIQYLASAGGLRRTSDLDAIFGGENPFVPGSGRLMRGENGLSMDDALRSATDAGYLFDPAEHAPGPLQNAHRTLLDLIEKEAHGAKQYRFGHAPALVEEEGARLHAIDVHLRDELEKADIDPEKIAPDILDRTVRMLHTGEHADALHAFERAVMERSEQDESHHATRLAEFGEIPGWDVPFEPGAAPAIGAGLPGEEAGRAVAGERTGERGAAARDVGAGDREAAIAAEHDLAQREGRELFQRPQAPAFYSAVERAVTSAKQPKASPEQWLATIRNTAGVKAEELEWLGLGDWLKEQKGPVTREQVADYVRANQIELKEVTKGAAGAPVEASVAMRRALGDQVRRGHISSGHADELLHGAQQGEAKSIGDMEELGVDDALISPFRDMGGGPTKYSSYVLPSAEPGSYREMLLTLPTPPAVDRYSTRQHPSGAWEVFDRTTNERVGYQRLDREDVLPEQRALNENADTYQSSHWEEPNIIAHIRLNDRTIDGKKALFVEEVQSDWHQAGRRQGYGAPASAEDAIRVQRAMLNAQGEFGNHIRRSGKSMGETEQAVLDVQNGHPPAWLDERGRALADTYKAAFDAHQAVNDTRHRVPDAPFKTTWPELALKRILRYAAEGGYEKVAWAPGEVHADRYSLAHQVDAVHYDTTTKRLEAFKDGQRLVDKPDVEPKDLPDQIGKEAADRLLNSPTEKQRGGNLHVLSGLDLKVGGEGMAGFYDRILPAAANKLVKKFGAKVGEDQIKLTTAEDLLSAGIDHYDVHSIDITPALRDAATEQGFPLFQRAQGKINLNPTGVPGRDFLGVPDVRPLMTLYSGANASTPWHEGSHAFLAQLMRDAAHPLAPDDLKADARTTLDWLGVKSAEDIGRQHHEQFANGGIQYAMEGVAPSPALARVFARFKEWLGQIYATLKALQDSVPRGDFKLISEEMRGVYDRLFAMEPQRTVFAEARERGPSLHDIHEADAAHVEPHEAGAAADRVAAETVRAEADLSREAQNEIQSTEAKAIEAGRAEPATGTEPGGEDAGGPAAAQPLERPGGGPGPVAGDRGGRQELGPLRPSGSATAAEGGSLPGSEQRRPAGAGAGANPLAPEPATLFGPDESPFTDRAGNIRVENLTNRQDVAQAIRDAAAENNDFIGDRRGIVTDGQVMELADALGMDFARLNTRKIGQAFNAEQVVAARRLLVQSATDVSAAMKRAAVGTDEDVMAYAMAKDRHQMIQAQVAGITAEAGRALRAFQSIAGEGGEKAQAIDQFIKTATGKSLFQLRMEAKMGATLDTPGKVSKFLADAQKRSFGSMLLEYWINGLISGPTTHLTYAVGNTILAAEKAGPETAAAAMIGAARRAMGREGSTVRLGEVGAQFKGAIQGLAGGVEAGIEGFRTGMTTLLPGETARPLMPFIGDRGLVTARNATNDPVTWREVGAQTFGLVRGLRDGLLAGAALVKAGGQPGAPMFGWHNSPLGQIPDLAYRGVPVLPLGSAVRAPGRFIAAIHSFFRSINYSMEKSAVAYRTASEERLAGSAFDARVADIRQNPTEAQMEGFRETATGLTLMGGGSEFVKQLGRLTNVRILGFPFLKFVDPFVHISGNIIEQAVIQRTPVGVLAPEIRADLMGKNGTIAQDTAQARMLVGSALAVTFGSLAAQGLVTGSGPQGKDATETRNLQATWRLAGYQPHSIRIGDTWYQTNRLGPMGMLMGISADLYDVAHAAEKGEMIEAAAALQHAFAQNVLDESFARGPAELLQAVEDPGRYGQAYIRNMLSSFVPFSVGMSQMARGIDPYSRQARSLTDAIKAKIPGLSQTLFPRRDVWGEPIANPEALPSKGITAIYETRLSKDPVNIAMWNLGVAPSAIERKIRNVDLTDAQADDYARIAGRMAKMRLDAVVRSADFQTWPTHIRHDVMSETITKSREAARGVMMMKYPTIGQQATQARLDKLHGVTP